MDAISCVVGILIGAGAKLRPFLSTSVSTWSRGMSERFTTHLFFMSVEEAVAIRTENTLNRDIGTLPTEYDNHF